MNLNLEIVTPEKIVFKDEVDEVTCPTINGEISILPNHVGLVTRVSPGELVIRKSGKASYLAITGGFLEVANNKVSILADYAVREEDIEVAKAEEAKKRAEKLMEEKLSEKDFAIAQSELRKSILQLKVGRRRKSRI